jgi:hypothetical protein
LEKLGFPWILSSESSLFNGLRGIFCEEKFLSPFAAAAAAAGRAPAFLALQSRIGHRASLTRFLIFCNKIGAQPVPVQAIDRLDSRDSRKQTADWWAHELPQLHYCGP